jgi:hypothetical protein
MNVYNPKLGGQNRRRGAYDVDAEQRVDGDGAANRRAARTRARGRLPSRVRCKALFCGWCVSHKKKPSKTRWWGLFVLWRRRLSSSAIVRSCVTAQRTAQRLPSLQYPNETMFFSLVWLLGCLVFLCLQLRNALLLKPYQRY